MKFVQKINSPLVSSAVTATSISLVLIITFIFMEPVISRANVSDIFVVTQVITPEISFIAPAADITLTPSIPGLTGGTGNGSTNVSVTTNNTTGYNMTILFSSPVAMSRVGGGGNINNYLSTITADRTFVPQGHAQFAYSVHSVSDGADIHSTFLDNGTICGSGTSGVSECWLSPNTVAQTIVNRTSYTPPAGATTTIQFRVHVPASPTFVVPSGNYTATATLTAVIN